MSVSLVGPFNLIFFVIFASATAGLGLGAKEIDERSLYIYGKRKSVLGHRVRRFFYWPLEVVGIVRDAREYFLK